GTGDDAQVDLRLAELRVGRRDPPVTGQRQLATTAQSVPGDRGDDRLRDPRHGVDGPRDLLSAGGHLRVPDPRHLLDVGARGEPLPPAIPDHRMYLAVRGRLLGHLPQLPLNLNAQHVHRRPLQPERADAVRLLQPYQVTHDPDLLTSPAMRSLSARLAA